MHTPWPYDFPERSYICFCIAEPKPEPAGSSRSTPSHPHFGRCLPWMHSQSAPSNAFGGQRRYRHLALPVMTKPWPNGGEALSAIYFLHLCSCQGTRLKASWCRSACGNPRGRLFYRIKHTSLYLDSEEIQEQVEEPILNEVCAM